MRAFAAALAVATLLLAGCSSSPEADDPAVPPTPTAGSYAIEVEGFPLTPVAANSTFTFKDRIAGDAMRTSDHIGAHYGPNSTAAPSTTAYPVACQHTHGDLPGTYDVTCQAPVLPGTYYLRGHARIATGANATVSWWSDEHTFIVA